MSVSFGTTPINHMSILDDLALTCSTDKTVRIFRMVREENGTFDLELLTELHGHGAEITCAMFLSSSLLVSADLKGILILWTLNGSVFEIKSKFSVCEGPVTSLCEIKPVTPSDTKTSFDIVCGCFDGYLRNLSISAETLEIKLDDSIFCSEYGVSSVSYLDGYLLTGGNNSKVNLYKNFKDEKISDQTYDKDSGRKFKLLKTYKDHKNRINDVSMIMGTNDAPHSKENIETMKGLIFASASSDKSVRIYTYGKNTQPDLNHPDELQHAPLTTQTLTFPEPVYKVTYDPVSMCLTVAFGSNHVHCYLPDIDGKFVKTELEEITE